MQRWNRPSIESISDFKSWSVIFCSPVLDVRYTVDLDTLTSLDVCTSRVNCQIDFKELWGLFGKLISHHFDREPGTCHFIAFSWSYPVPLVFSSFGRRYSWALPICGHQATNIMYQLTLVEPARSFCMLHECMQARLLIKPSKFRDLAWKNLTKFPCKILIALVRKYFPLF